MWLTTLVMAASMAQATSDSTRVPSPPPLIAAPRDANLDPAEPVATASDRGAQLRALIDRRKARHSRAVAARARALRARTPSMSTGSDQPISPADAASLQVCRQEAMALQEMAQANRIRALVDQSRFVLQSQQAGVPQIFVPGMGMMPYRYGIATPQPVLIYPQGPTGAVTGSTAPGP